MDLTREHILEQMLKDVVVRTKITRESHLLFFYFYFAHYVTYAVAEFQQEIFALTESRWIKNFFIVAFRGSGKSTIITTSYPIWAILGKQQKKFVLILCQTRAQAKQHMMNLKRELESNEVLKNDLGPFQEENEEWGSSSLVFSRQNARITVASTEQSIRGLRHNQHRPDLIIADDVEDINSTKTKEGRDKTHQWLTSEVIPAGDLNTRLVVIGNLLHEDSLLMRLKRGTEEGRIEGEFKEYPLVDATNTLAWPGKYPDATAIEVERRRTGNERSWQREYLLRIIPDEVQVVYREWIQYYDQLPSTNNLLGAYIGVDLAISENETADRTAIISAWVNWKDDLQIFILPHPVNEHPTFPETLKMIENRYKTLGQSDRTIIVEDVGYQRAVIQALGTRGYEVKGQKIRGDKRSRLTTITHLIQGGDILFPRHGAEELIQQLIGFGVERYDDLVDALTVLVHGLMEEDLSQPEVHVISTFGPAWSIGAEDEDDI